MGFLDQWKDYSCSELPLPCLFRQCSFHLLFASSRSSSLICIHLVLQSALPGPRRLGLRLLKPPKRIFASSSNPAAFQKLSGLTPVTSVKILFHKNMINQDKVAAKATNTTTKKSILSGVCFHDECCLFLNMILYFSILAMFPHANK